MTTLENIKNNYKLASAEANIVFYYVKKLQIGRAEHWQVLREAAKRYKIDDALLEEFIYGIYNEDEVAQMHLVRYGQVERGNIAKA